MRVHHFEPTYLPGLRTLINLHLSAVVPGWSLPDEAVAVHIDHNYGEYVTDPWVIEHTTLLATEGWRVLAAIHRPKAQPCRESSLVVKEVDNVGNRYFSGTPRVVAHAKSLSVL
ncbi:MAG: hypothetical protein ACR2G1_02210 [Rubrobacteraceae bacterium]